MFRPSGLLFYITKTSRNTHGTRTRDTRHTLPNVDDNTPQTCLRTGKAELGEPCSSKEMHTYASIYVYYLSKTHTHEKKQMGRKKPKKANEEKSKKERLPGLELASSNSKLHPSYQKARRERTDRRFRTGRRERTGVRKNSENGAI